MKRIPRAPIRCLSCLCLGLTALALPSPRSPSNAANSPVSSRANVYVEIPELPLDALVTAATNVIYGKVLGSRAVFPARGLPYTEYDLEVYAAFKQPAGPVTSFAVGGAARAGEAVDVIEAPSFIVGEEVVLLTWSGTADLPPGILGLGLGTYRVGLDASGALMARRDRSGVTMPLGHLIVDIDAAVRRERTAREEAK